MIGGRAIIVRPVARVAFDRLIVFEQQLVNLRQQVFALEPQMQVAVLKDAHPEIVAFHQLRQATRALGVFNLAHNPVAMIDANRAAPVKFSKNALNVVQRVAPVVTLPAAPAFRMHRAFDDKAVADCKSVMRPKAPIHFHKHICNAPQIHIAPPGPDCPECRPAIFNGECWRVAAQTCLEFFAGLAV